MRRFFSRLLWLLGLGANASAHGDSLLLRTFYVVTALGVLLILLYAFQFAANQAFGVVAVGVGAAGTAAFGGALLGFLFGIPRTLQGSPRSGDATSDGIDHAGYGANTNLEQISDWLTKIIVGVSLVQLGTIVANGERLVLFLATGLGNISSSPAFAFAIISYFGISGFLYSYLWTRLALASALTSADIRIRLQRIEDQPSKDARALALTNRQLKAESPPDEVSQRELSDAIVAASDTVRIQIFNQAQTQRSTNWETDKVRMVLTIPIFRALIAADASGRFHRNHAQLGYALKDQAQPDWSTALAELNTAIRIRDRVGDSGWGAYEFVRAECTIRLDDKYSDNQPSDSSVQDKIVNDLRVATRSGLRDWVHRNSDVQQWVRLNGVSADQLR
jgi:hypothetical protein